MTLDISHMLIGKSDQLDNVDLLSGPRDFTITAVSNGNAEQPLNISLAEYERPWRPGLTMRRLLAHIWGKDASLYIGRRVRLYRDAEVTFGKDKTGGTRISHASHIDNAVTVSLPTSKGKFGAFTVQPLESIANSATNQASTDPTDAQIADATTPDELMALWNTSSKSATVKAKIAARKAELDAAGMEQA